MLSQPNNPQILGQMAKGNSKRRKKERVWVNKNLYHKREIGSSLGSMGFIKVEPKRGPILLLKGQEQSKEYSKSLYKIRSLENSRNYLDNNRLTVLYL